MLDQETFLKVKQRCCATLAGDAFLLSQINHSTTISQLLTIIKNEATRAPIEHDIHTTLQQVCNTLICAHIENIMHSKAHADSFAEDTLLDWNRNGGCDWLVNNQKFSRADTIAQFREWLRMNNIKNLNLINLISEFANQHCWLGAIAIFKQAYVHQGFILSVEMDSLPITESAGWSEWFYQKVQNLSPFSSPTKALPVQKNIDSVAINSCGTAAVTVTLVKYFPRMLDLKKGTMEQVLNPPLSITVQFDVACMNPFPTAGIYNFSLQVENLPDELISTPLALAHHFLQQESVHTIERSQTPPPGLPSMPGSPTKHMPPSPGTPKSPRRATLALPGTPYATALNTPIGTPLPSPAKSARSPLFRHSPRQRNEAVDE